MRILKMHSIPGSCDLTSTVNKIEGIVSATPTPIDAEGGIDRTAVSDLIENLIAANTAGIAPIGGTGEATALSRRQKRGMLDATLEAVAGRVPVIPGLLSPGLGDTLEEAAEYAAAGADMLMLVTPYYARPTEQGFVDYFKRVSDSVDLPLMLYEIPYRTGIQLSLETVVRLADETRVTAMKACSLDTRYQMQTVELVGDRVSILTGQEDVFPLHMAMGARGGMLAGSCIIPNLWNKVYKLCADGKNAEALALHQEIMPFISMLYREHNPGPIKAALELMGLSHGGCLPPLRSATPEVVEALKLALPAILEKEKSAANQN